jgi:hypothetical protein
MPPGASGFDLGLVRFWFVLVRARAGASGLKKSEKNTKNNENEPARTRTNQNEPETNQTQMKSTRTMRHERTSMGVLPSLFWFVLVRAERARAD